MRSFAASTPAFLLIATTSLHALGQDAPVEPPPPAPDPASTVPPVAPDAVPPPDAAPSDVAAPPPARAANGAAKPAADASQAEGPNPYALSVGIRIGYDVPLGLVSEFALNQILTGAVPLGIDAGYFVNRHFYVGGSFQYAFGLGSNDSAACPTDQDVSCTSTALRFSAVARWHFFPTQTFDPWAGGGIAYDTLNLGATDSSGQASSLGTLHGFALDAQGGVDYKPLPYLGIGPYADLMAGHYVSTVSSAIHAWLGFGLRARTGF